ncbi:MAG: hypothetical protein MI919_27725 [Holophagales bacterium]|nr:hypothetical protein [Holophagales bacterium]
MSGRRKNRAANPASENDAQDWRRSRPLALPRLASAAILVVLLMMMASGRESEALFAVLLGLAAVFETIFWVRFVRRRRGPKIDTRPPGERD